MAVSEYRLMYCEVLSVLVDVDGGDVGDPCCIASQL